MIKSKHRVNILWSDEDECYLVELPEFGNKIQRYFTHGETYEEAMRNAQEVLDLLIEEYQAEGKPLPLPQIETAMTSVTASLENSKLN